MSEAPAPASTFKVRAAAVWRSPILWIAVWGLSIWTGLAHRFGRHETWFADYRTMTCAADHRAAGLPIYGFSSKCPGGSTYVYPPWVADASGTILKLAGGPVVTGVYLLLLAASVIALVYWLFRARPPEADILQRAPFLAFISGGPLAFGNIALILHAGMIGAALAFGGESIVFGLAVAIAGLIKPQLLTMLLVTVLAPAPLWRRGVIVIAAAALPLFMLTTHYQGLDLWRAAVSAAVLNKDVGGGFLGWAESWRVTSRPVIVIGYALYAGVVLLAALALCEGGKADRSERLWIAVTAAMLVMPRIQSYDIFVLGLGCLAAMNAAARVEARYTRLFTRLWIAAAVVSLIGATGGGALRFLMDIRLWLLAGGMIWAGVIVGRQWFAERRAAFAAPIASAP